MKYFEVCIPHPLSVTNNCHFPSPFKVRSLVLLEAVFYQFLSQNIPGADLWVNVRAHCYWKWEVSLLTSFLVFPLVLPHQLWNLSHPAWARVYLHYRKDTEFVFLQWIKWTELAQGKSSNCREEKGDSQEHPGFPPFVALSLGPNGDRPCPLAATAISGQVQWIGRGFLLFSLDK